MSSETRLPGYLRFVWMFFMQPVSLHRRLKACGIEDTDAPSWALWRSFGGQRVRRAYLARLSATLALMLFPLTVAWLLQSAGLHVKWSDVGAAIFAGLVFAVIIGMVLSAALGVALGIGLSVAGVVNPVNPFLVPDLATGVLTGLMGGVAASLVGAVAIGMLGGLAIRADVAAGVGLALGVVFGVAFGADFGADYGVGLGVGFVLACLRLPVFLAEALHQSLLYWRQKLFGALDLDSSPVLWHELSYLPLPFLRQHIEIMAARDPELARRTLAACEIAPGQRRVGRVALARIQGRELEAIGREGRFRAFVDGDTQWLPPDASADVETATLRQIARYALAAEAARSPGQRLDHLHRAQKDLDGLEITLLERRTGLHGLPQTLVAAWQQTIAERRAAAEGAAEGRLPNPFRAGEPLEPDLGRDVFRGRDEVARKIERLLADPSRSTSIALLAPRRCGKTSMLKMLPVLLPDAVCVFFDLQKHPVDTPAGFFQTLDREVRVQTRRSRGLELPALGDGPPFEAAGRWLEALEGAAGGRRLLLCLDEFETLERTFPGDRRDLLKLMGLFRAIIQHRRKVRLLVAGEAPFDELDAIWNDHFISVREVRFGHLEAATARELVERPTPDFPAGALSAEVAARIVERTGGQPYLVQLYAQLAVELLNEQDRSSATLDDLGRVESTVLEEAGYTSATAGSVVRTARAGPSPPSRGAGRRSSTSRPGSGCADASSSTTTRASRSRSSGAS